LARRSAWPGIRLGVRLAGLALPLPSQAADLPPDHASPRATSERIIAAAMESDEAMRKITYLSDRIGHRLSGSSQLARAVDWAVEQMELDGLENVRRQRVMVPHWVRGAESAEMVAPRRAELAMLGLGRSVATPPGGLTAPVVVVESFDALRALPDEQVRGRIVLWDVPFTTYSETAKYRWDGANEAAAKGACASLLRSVGRGGLRTPHTGAMDEYREGGPRIPAAALSIEDAMMLARLARAGEEVAVRLEMDARTFPDVESHNVIGEIVGRELADEVVVIGGHIDSWDVGQGAQDDGAGCVVSMEAARILVDLGIRPRRTVRVVLWTNEENGTAGAEHYRDSLGDDVRRTFAAIESDGGVEDPWGFGVSVWKNEDREVDEDRQARVLDALAQIAPLLAGVGADSLAAGGGGADISPLMERGVPGLALRTPMELYWDIHHTEGDTVDKIDAAALNRNVAAMAVMAWALAELRVSLD
jgi:carboxypeptidase Q